MSGVRTLKVNFEGDTKDLKKASDQAGAAVDGWGSKIKKFGAVVAGASAVAGVALFALAKTSVKAASDLNETVSKTQVIFGNTSDAMLKFADTADKMFGISKQAALDSAASFALFAKSAGLTGQGVVKFSTQMTGLASDLASFFNTSPEDAITAIGAALRGESEPIRRYNVLLDDATLRQAALRLGLVKTTKQALTPQQRVLAAQAEILRQTTAAQGDFARTSGGLANQQRIAAAQVANLKAKIGTALLPVMTSLVTTLNTKLLPVLTDLWAQHGPKVTAFFEAAASKLGPFVDKMSTFDFAAFGRKLGDAFEKLLPQLKEIGGSTGKEAFQVVKLGGTVLQFAADHADTFAKLLPVLIAGFIAYKVAQSAETLVAVARLPIRVAEIISAQRMRAALQAHTAALIENTVVARVGTVATATETAAVNVGFLARARATAGLVATKIAMVAVRTATLVWTAAQWLLNVALTANPIGLVIVAIAALIAIIVLIATKTTWFQSLWKVTWTAIKVAAMAVWDWMKGIPGMLASAFSTVADIITLPFRTGFNAIAKLWNNTLGKLSFTIPGWIPGIGGNHFSMPNIPTFHSGGIVPGPAGADVLAMLQAGERVIPASQAGDGTVLETHIHIGDEVVRVVRSVIRNDRRNLTRLVTAGAGTR